MRLLTKSGGRLGVPGKGEVRGGRGENGGRRVTKFWTEAFWKDKPRRKKGSLLRQ